MAIGLGIGIQKSKFLTSAVVFANSFEQRVLADGGTFEAKSCLVRTISELSTVG